MSTLAAGRALIGRFGRPLISYVSESAVALVALGCAGVCSYTGAMVIERLACWVATGRGQEQRTVPRWPAGPTGGWRGGLPARGRGQGAGGGR